MRKLVVVTFVSLALFSGSLRADWNDTKAWLLRSALEQGGSRATEALQDHLREVTEPIDLSDREFRLLVECLEQQLFDDRLRSVRSMGIGLGPPYGTKELMHHRLRVAAVLASLLPREGSRTYLAGHLSRFLALYFHSSLAAGSVAPILPALLLGAERLSVIESDLRDALRAVAQNVRYPLPLRVRALRLLLREERLAPGTTVGSGTFDTEAFHWPVTAPRFFRSMAKLEQGSDAEAAALAEEVLYRAFASEGEKPTWLSSGQATELRNRFRDKALQRIRDGQVSLAALCGLALTLTDAPL